MPFVFRSSRVSFILFSVSRFRRLVRTITTLTPTNTPLRTISGAVLLITFYKTQPVIPAEEVEDPVLHGVGTQNNK